MGDGVHSKARVPAGRLGLRPGPPPLPRVRRGPRHRPGPVRPGLGRPGLVAALVSAPTGALAEALDAAPLSVRATLRSTLRQQCAGDWARVRINPDGSFTVRNGAAAPRGRTRTTPQAAPGGPCGGDLGPLPAPAPDRPTKPATAAPAVATAAPSTPPARAAVGEAPTMAPGAPAPTPLRGRCTHIQDDGHRCPVLVPEPGDRCGGHNHAGGRVAQAALEASRPAEPTRPTQTRASGAKARKKRGKNGSLGFKVRPDTLRQLYEAAKEAGCHVSQSSKHVRIMAPGGGLTFGPSTASEYRSVRNVRADIRRLGVAV